MYQCYIFLHTFFVTTPQYFTGILGLILFDLCKSAPYKIHTLTKIYAFNIQELHEKFFDMVNKGETTDISAVQYSATG